MASSVASPTEGECKWLSGPPAFKLVQLLAFSAPKGCLPLCALAHLNRAVGALWVKEEALGCLLTLSLGSKQS